MKYILFFCYFAGICLGLTFLNIPPALLRLQDLYGVSYTGMSILMGALLWSHALLQIPSGIIIDRLSLRKAVLAGVLLMTAGNFIPAAAPDILVAVCGRIVTGFGTGITFISVMKLIVLTAPGRRAGSYQAFYAAFFSAGSILAYLLIPLMLPFGWESAYLFPGAGCLALSFLWLGLPRRIPESRKNASPPLRSLFSIRSGWILGFYHALAFGSFMALGNWLPSLLAEMERGGGATGLSWGGAVVLAMGGLGRVSGGLVLMRISSLRVANASLLTLALLFLFLWLGPGGLVLPLAFAAAWVSSVSFGALFHLASTAVDSESMATFFGFINFLANLGAVLFTVAFGIAKDLTGSFYAGFGVLALCAALAFFSGKDILRRECAGESCRISAETRIPEF